MKKWGELLVVFALVLAVVGVGSWYLAEYRRSEGLKVEMLEVDQQLAKTRVDLAGESLTPPQDWEQEIREILDNVGGPDIDIDQGEMCGGLEFACSREGVISVHPDIADRPLWDKYWVMTHELAHQYQYRVWDQIEDSQTYQKLLRGDIEVLANCMAAVRGYNVGVSCTGSRWDFAEGIWEGEVREAQ